MDIAAPVAPAPRRGLTMLAVVEGVCAGWRNGC
jgi:hypothetical protein